MAPNPLGSALRSFGRWRKSVKQTRTRSSDEDVTLLDWDKYSSGYVAQLPCAPAQKIGTCCQNLWELPWGFEMQLGAGRGQVAQRE